MSNKLTKCPACSEEVQLVNGIQYSLFGHKYLCKLAGKRIQLVNPEVEAKLTNISILPEVKPKKNIPEGRIPYPYQQPVIDWAVKQDKIPLFVDMRLGKSLMIIKTLKEKYGEDYDKKRVLIVVPKPIMDVWKDQLAFEGITPLIINTNVDKALRFIIEKAKGWFLTNYESLTYTAKNTKRIVKAGEHYPVRETKQVKKHTEAGDVVLVDTENEREVKTDEEAEDYGISKLEWDAVILDESHRIRDPRTKISKICTQDFSNVQTKAILTGTPAPEGFLEYFPQLNFLYPQGICGCRTYKEFEKKFTYFNQEKQERQIMPGFRSFLAEEIGKIAYVLKRHHVGRGSEKVEEVRYVQLEGEYKANYEAFEEDWMHDEYSTEWALAAYQELHKLSGGYPPNRDMYSNHKIDELENIVTDDFKNEQTLIWCVYTRELKAAYQRLKDLGRKPQVIHGDIPQQKRTEYIEKARLGEYTDLVIQTRTGKEGLDLSFCDQSIYLSNWIGAIPYLQSSDRMIHPDKTCPILLLHIIAKNTLCEDIYHALQGKSTNQDDFMKAIHESFKRRTGRG